MSTVPDSHRQAAGRTSVRCAVITCSDTRTREADTSGALMCKLLEAAGHEVSGPDIVREDAGLVERAIRERVQSRRAILLNGGTGVSARDGTVEAVKAVIDRELPGFGELFRILSYQEIGAAAMLSRAVAGVAGDTVIFATPGSTAAVRLAMEQLIIPELRHIAGILDRE